MAVKGKIMRRIAPEGDVYQAGTLSGNPLAMAAGIATLNIFKTGKTPMLNSTGKAKPFFPAWRPPPKRSGIPARVNRMGSMGCLFFTSEAVTDFTTAQTGNPAIFRRYYKEMLNRGVYLAPSPFETSFLSLAHTDKMIQETIDRAEQAFEAVAQGPLTVWACYFFHRY